MIAAFPVYQKDFIKPCSSLKEIDIYLLSWDALFMENRLSPKRIKKTITLSEDTAEVIKEFAAQNGLNFSQANEILALNGSQRTDQLALNELIQ